MHLELKKNPTNFNEYLKWRIDPERGTIQPEAYPGYFLQSKPDRFFKVIKDNN
jgi:hypothetical protein